mmetsp:Transcript_21337/g.54108  ORF Transcript_21337/g.54108 Transcript_21337/m.54108 type:complete len:233 (-) Transcript_21337:380-1078(-)
MPDAFSAREPRRRGGHGMCAVALGCAHAGRAGPSGARASLDACARSRAPRPRRTLAQGARVQIWAPKSLAVRCWQSRRRCRGVVPSSGGPPMGPTKGTVCGLPGWARRGARAGSTWGSRPNGPVWPPSRQPGAGGATRARARARPGWRSIGLAGGAVRTRPARPLPQLERRPPASVRLPIRASSRGARALRVLEVLPGIRHLAISEGIALRKYSVGAALGRRKATSDALVGS